MGFRPPQLAGPVRVTGMGGPFERLLKAVTSLAVDFT